MFGRYPPDPSVVILLVAPPRTSSNCARHGDAVFWRDRRQCTDQPAKTHQHTRTDADRDDQTGGNKQITRWKICNVLTPSKVALVDMAERFKNATHLNPSSELVVVLHSQERVGEYHWTPFVCFAFLVLHYLFGCLLISELLLLPPSFFCSTEKDFVLSVTNRLYNNKTTPKLFHSVTIQLLRRLRSIHDYCIYRP